jgi:hypothetical protein
MTLTLTTEHISPRLTTVEKLRGLLWSIAANVANAIFCQFTFFGSVFPLFTSRTILHECATRLDEWGADRVEVLLLGLHVLMMGWERESERLREQETQNRVT